MLHKVRFQVALTIFSLCFCSLHAIAEEEGPTLQTLSSYSRITIPVNPKSTFTVQQVGSDPSQVLLKLDGYSKFKSTGLAGIHDERVKSLSLLKESGPAREIGIALTKREYEYFAYFQPNPAAVIIDVWPRTDLPNAAKNAQASPESAKRSFASTKKSGASGKIKAPSTVAPLDIQKNFFYEFPVVNQTFTYSGKNFDTSREREIDSGWAWSDPDLKQPGGVNFSLAQKLYANKQYSLCIKSVEFARRDVPDGPYMDEMDFMEAMAYRRLGKAEKNKFLTSKSDEKMQELMLRQSKAGGYAPFAAKIRIYFASEAYRQERWLDAISHFEFITSEKNSDKEEDYPGIIMASAEAYFQLRQFRRAERIYRTMMEKAPGSQMAMEAAYRLGNIHSQERAFSKADGAIRKALREFPEYEKNRSEAYFNLAEADFWAGDYAKAKASFEKFIELHPSNPLASYAYVRLGELAELTEKSIAKSRDLYITAINRFPFSAGDTLGRIRQARIDLEQEKDLNYQIEYLQKINEAKDQPNQVRLMAQETLIHYLLRAKRLKDAVHACEDGMSKTSGTGYEIMKNLYLHSLQEHVATLNKEKKYDLVLALYKEKTTWLEQTGPSIFLRLADAYKGLGFLSTSNEYLTKYLAEESKKPKSRQPSSIDSDRERAIMTQARTEFLQGRYATVLETLVDLNDGEAQRLKVLSLTKLERFEEAKNLAKKSLDAFLKNKSAGKGTDADSIIIDLTEAMVAWADSRKEYNDMEVILDNSMDELENHYERFDFLMGDALWYQQKNRKAVEAYKNAADLFPKSSRVERANYRRAMSHIALGERMEAVKLLTKLAASSQNIWGESARQELKLIAWEKKYSVILGDLPPMGLGL